MKELFIKSEFIKLDAALKFSNSVSSGGQAKIEIAEQKVKVNGEVCTARGKKLKDGDTFTYNNETFTVKNENK